jgi:hypothetical protein
MLAKLPRTFGLVAVAVVLAAGCGDSKTIDPGTPCVLNSDCNNPLSCTYGKCHEGCRSTTDCRSGEKCTKVSGLGVCLLAAEVTCTVSNPVCGTSLVCASDLHCRSICANAVTDCMDTQACVSGVCADQADLDVNGQLPQKNPVLDAGIDSQPSSTGRDAPDDPNSGVATDLPTTGTGGVTGTGGGAALDGGKGGAGDSGTDAPAVVQICPQTQFGFVAEGDTNLNFVSGLGLRTATQLLIFNGYHGPDPTVSPDAGSAAPTVNYVYVQAFDPSSAKSLGPAQPLFAANASDANGLILQAAAISPGGQIALIYQSASAGMGVAFLDTVPGDASAGAVNYQVSRLVPLEVSTLGSQPQAIWSATYGAFVFSWRYYQNGPWTIKVRKFLSDGRSAGGDTDSVPTNQSNNNTSGNPSGTVAASRTLFGVTYLAGSSNAPYLTVLDALGNQVGATLPLQATPAAAAWETAGGTNAGFVTFYDQGGVGATLVPVTSEGAVPAVQASIDAGVLPNFHFSGIKTAVHARALNDDVGGAGGVGLALLYSDGVAFAYVNADGLTHVGPASVMAHTYNGSDRINISNFAGSFAVSLYAAGEHRTHVAASSCQ